MNYLRIRILIATLALLMLGACSPATQVQSPQLATEESVKPGINDSYLNPALKPQEWVERFEREGREVFDQRMELVEAVNITKGATVADIGSGTGLFTPLLAKATGTGGKVYAVDIVPAFLARIRQQAELKNIVNIKTVLCTERSTRLYPNTVDFAFICDVYHHFQYPQNTLASLHQALKAGGEVFLIDFKRIEGVSSDFAMNHVRASQEEVTAEMEAAGFVLVEELDLLEDNYVLRFVKK